MPPSSGSAATSSSVSAAPPRGERQEVARRETPAGEALAERRQVGDAESMLELGERAERQAKRVALSAELDRGLAAAGIGHSSSPS